MAFEFTILNYIQTLRTPVGDILMPFFSMLANGGWFWILLTLILLICPKTRKVGILCAAALVVEAIGCNLVLKPLVARTRPCDVNTAVQLLIARPTDYSFPSGHTGASFAVTAALFLAGEKRLAWPALILSLVIGFSRMYLYVHYPTDVLAGAVLGILSAWAGAKIVGWMENRRKQSIGNENEAKG